MCSGLTVLQNQGECGLALGMCKNMHIAKTRSIVTLSPHPCSISCMPTQLHISPY